jgi:hypothetical protein
MPVTPLHFGPGLLIKAMIPRHFSWCAFATANVLIDIEPAAYWVIEGEPAHRFFHTYIGASMMGVLAAVLTLLLLPGWLRWWNRQLSPTQAKWLGVEIDVTLFAVCCGALLGAWSHVLLDSIMHHDVVPFLPIALCNALVGVMSISDLYLACLVLGCIGGGVMLAARWRQLFVVR